MGRRTQLYDDHADRGAQFTEFGGWEMPVEFDSIRTEHQSVRESVGRFDVSHMGEIRVTGPDAAALMDRLTTNDVRSLDRGEGQYSAITDEEGVLLDDTIVYRLPDGEFLFVPNAGHDAEMADRWRSFRDEWDVEATVENETEEWGLIAVQGPDAPARYESVTGDSFGLAHERLASREIAGADCLVAATGYTGEPGFEAFVPSEAAPDVWQAFDCQSCGLGARDTLRLEKGFLLAGQEFDPEDNPRTPFEAGIDFVVDLDTEFVGRDALAATADPEDQLVGLRMEERGIARQGHAIETSDGDPVGEVTSGTMSPTLGEPIALGYCEHEYADPGTDLRVRIRDEPKRARITTTPFV